MSTIKFYLKSQKNIDLKTNPLKIYVRYQIGRHVDFRASIKESLLQSDWDEVKQRAKNRNTIKNREVINKRITDIQSHLSKYDIANSLNGHIPNYKEVRTYFDSYFTVSEPTETKPINLLSFISELIDSDEIKRAVTSGTIRAYRTTENILKLFNDKVYHIDFDNINMEFYNDFVLWCEKQNLSLNYIGKHIKTLKTFMNHAVEKKLTDNLKYKSDKFKVLKEDSENVYLSIDELNKLYHLDLSHDKRLQDIRDLFLLGSFTGLRVSDYNNLSKDSIVEVEGVRMIKVKTKKTKKEVAIPLHPIVEQILSKNGGNPPPKIPEQKINEKIKELCESAEIDNIEYITKTRGGKQITVKKYKFELVQTHTARRSFCTNAYFAKVPSIDIMTISGHSTEKAFLTYIKRTPEQTAIKMSQHEFFQGNNHLKVV